MDALPPWLSTVIAVVVLAAIATVSLAAMRVPAPWAGVGALARAVLQLSLLSLVLAGIIDNPLLVGVGLLVMLVAAIWTAARRAHVPWRGVPPLALSMLLGPLTVMIVAFSTGALEFTPRYALAIGGIIIGNTMTVAILDRAALPGRCPRSLGRGRRMARTGRLSMGVHPRPCARRDTHRTPALDRSDAHHRNRGSARSVCGGDLRWSLPVRGRAFSARGARRNPRRRRADRDNPASDVGRHRSAALQPHRPDPRRKVLSVLSDVTAAITPNGQSTRPASNVRTRRAWDAASRRRAGDRSFRQGRDAARGSGASHTHRVARPECRPSPPRQHPPPPSGRLLSATVCR